MAVEVPLRAVPPPADVFLVRASNILGIEAEPWDAAAFASAQADATARERVRDLTTVRWRWVTRPDGSRARQSNARLVRWSDGSQQLLLGRDVLDVRAIDVSADQQFLLARHAQTIQGQGQLACKLVFRPASLESAFHRRLAASVDGGAARAAPKVRGTATVADPARAKRERELHEEAGIRERERAAERKARTLQRNAAYRPAAPRLSSAYLEEEDEPAYEEEGIDLRRPRYDPDEEVIWEGGGWSEIFLLWMMCGFSLSANEPAGPPPCAPDISNALAQSLLCAQARAVARLAAAQRGGDGAGKRGRTIASDDEEEELSDDDGDDLDVRAGARGGRGGLRAVGDSQ